MCLHKRAFPRLKSLCNHPITKRWLQILLYSFLAASIVIITLGLSHKPLCDWITKLISPQPWWVPSSCVLILFLPWAFTKPGLKSRFLRLRHIHRYPPLWVSAWAALLFCVGTINLLLGSHEPWSTIREDMAIPSLTSLSFTCFLGIPGILILLAKFYPHLKRRFCKKENTTKPNQPEDSSIRPHELHLDNPDAFLQWLRTDKPLTSLAQDCLDHQIIARRMAKRLALDPPPSQAVRGDFGTGKTTLGKLVQDALSRIDARDVRVIHIELWPCASIEAALETILRKIVDELETEVALPHLRKLPEHYVDAVKATGGLGACLMHLLYGSQTDAKSLLSQLNEVADIINLRIVLWIDDLERFVGMDDQERAQTNEAIKQLAPIRALVDLLGQKPPEDHPHAIIPVYATTRLQSAFDLTRIADYVEELKVVGVEKAAEIFRTLENIFRDSKRWPNVIDPTSASQRDHAWDHELEALTSLLKIEGFPIRQLKASLRRAYEYWEHNPGEVDPHDLLLLKLIKETNGGAELIDRLKDYRGLKPETESPKEDQSNVEHVSTLACAFGFREKGIEHSPFHPQGANLKNNIYWQRIMAEPKITEAESDQLRYRKIKKAAQSGDHEVLSKAMYEYHSGEVALEQEDNLFENYPFLKDIWPPKDTDQTPDS